MLYNPSIENFEDLVDFNQNSHCTWIVYPAGAAGDLLASIVNFHYVRTGARFFGFADNGQAVFRDSNNKDFNHNQKVDQHFINTTNQALGNHNLNLSLLDNVIFSNHGWQQSKVKQIVDFFPNAKVIRILPYNNVESSIVKWLSNYKNQNKIGSFKLDEKFEPLHGIAHPRVLEIRFGHLFQEETFEQCYTGIVDFLNLGFKLIRFDFVKFWLSKQHPTIQDQLLKLSS